MTGKDDMSFQASELRRQAEEMALEKPALSLEEIHAMSTEEIQQILHELRVHQIELEMQKEELRRAQAQIEAGRSRYFDLYDQAPVGYCTLSEHGLIIEANLTAATLLGLSRSELATQPLSRFIHSDDQHIYSLHHKQLLETATLQKCDLRLVKPGGDYIWAHLKETVIRADDGAPLCRVVLSDISDRIRAEKQRETLAQKYAAVVSTTRDAVLAVNLDSMITVFNPGAEKLFGCAAEEALGSPVMRFCPEDLLKEQTEIMRHVLDTGAVAGYESERLTTDGRRIPVEITVSRNTNDQGSPSGVNAILRDITERKLVEDALRESMDFTNSIIHFTQDVIVFKDQNFIFRLVNPAFCKMIGKAQSEIIGKTDFDVFPYELAEKYRNDDKFILESGQSANFEETVSAYDGTRYVSTTKAPVLNDNNVCQGIVIIVRDITEHKRAEKALIESEALFRGMFEDHSAVMLLVDPNTGRIVLANQAAAQFYGFPLDNLLQMNIHQLNVLSPTEIAEKMAGAFNKQINIFEFQHKLADGQIRDVQVHSSPTTLQNQRLLLSIIHDITARKEADAKLQAFSRDFEAFLDQTTDFVYFKDLDSRIRFCSQTLASITGHRNWRDMVGKHDREIFPPDTAKIYEDEEEPVFSEGKPLLGKVDPYYDEKGEIGYVQTNKWPLFDADGRLVGIFGISRDITERKRAEAALKESEANFRLFFETVTDIMAVATPEGRILFTNQAARDKLGYSEDDLEGMHLLDWHQPEDRSEAERIFTAMIRGEQKHCPLPLAAKDGTLIPVETRVWFGQWSGQDCVFGICKDLSAQQEAQQRFERIFFTNPSPMALSSVPDRQLIEVNDAFLETIGYTREEVIGKSSVELGLIADPKAQNTVAEIMLAKRRIANYELQVLRKDGMLRDGLFSGEVIRSQGRECFLSVMIDITERKRAEEALREQRDFSESLIETAQAIILVLDAQGRIIRFNPYMEKLVGYALDEVKGKDWFETFLTPETSRTIKPLFEKAVNDIHTSGNVNPIIAKDGRRILVEWNDKTLKDKEGRTVGLLAIGQDITMRKQAETERKKLRAQLTQA